MIQTFFTVYQTTNLINGKIYIGSHTTQNPWDSYLGSGELLLKAIKKYGAHCFRKDILGMFESETEMYSKEAELVNESFVKRRDTYNIKLGGQGGWSYVNQRGLNTAWKKKIWITNGRLRQEIRELEFEQHWQPKGWQKGRVFKRNKYKHGQ